MFDTDTASPAAPEQGTGAGGVTEKAAPEDTTANPAADTEGQAGAKAEGDEGDKKPEKTPEQRERERMQRAIDRKTRQREEARAEAKALREELDRLTQRGTRDDNRNTADDSEPLSLTRAQLAEMVKAEAAKLAPTLNEQDAEVKRRQGVVQSLQKTWGQERFDELASDLDDAFGGLADRSGRPKPATEAVFEADSPARVIEYLADPENIDEAEAIAKLSAAQAGKAIAKLEAKLEAKAAEAKPKASKAPAPLEAVRGQGAATFDGPDPVKDPKGWRAWRNEQERKGLG